MSKEERDWYREQGKGNENDTASPQIYSAVCFYCRHSFRIRVPGNAVGKQKIEISCNCPNCGRPYTMTVDPSIQEKTGKKKDPALVGGIILAAFVLLVLILWIADRFLGIQLFRELAKSDVFKGVNSEQLMTLMARLIVLFICMPVHESAHALAALKLGDPTAKQLGRISLNPFRHLDFIGTMALLLLGVGYAKPVPVNINRFKNRKRDFALTSIAGPLSNMLMAILFLFILKFVVMAGDPNGQDYLIVLLLSYAAFINVALAVFNLIPVPPLDGSRIFMAVLPDKIYNGMLKNERKIAVVLIVTLILLGRLGISPISSAASVVFYYLYGLIL